MTINGHDNGQIRTPAVINCSASANPPVNYTWFYESKVKIADGPTIIIYNGGNYTCTVSNIIRGQRYQQSKSVTLRGKSRV